MKLRKNSKGKVDNQIKYQREAIERNWMKKLKTVYPYGLNNKCDKNREQRGKDEIIFIGGRSVYGGNTYRKTLDNLRGTNGTMTILLIHEDDVSDPPSKFLEELELLMDED